MKYTILLIDDSSVARMIVKKCFPPEIDCTIIEASNGQEGVEKYLEYTPDLVLLDLTMPVMDGFEALSQIRKESPDAVVIISTADVQQKVKTRVMELGATFLMKKPPSKESLRDALKIGIKQLKAAENV